MNIFGIHWKESLHVNTKNFLEAYNVCLQNGDLTYGCFSINNYLRNSFYSGKELSQLNKEFAVYLKKVKSMRQESAYYLIASLYQMNENLLGKVDDPSILSGEVFDPKRDLPKLEAQHDNASIGYFYLMEVMLSFLFGKYQYGLEQAAKFRKFIDNDLSTINVPLFYFYEALLISSFIKKSSGSLYRKFKSNLKKMKFYCDNAPVNHEHRYYLLVAEQGRLENDSDQAEVNYDKAVELSKAKGFPNDEAICSELAGKFYLGK